MRVIIKITLTFAVIFVAIPLSFFAKQVPFLNLILIAGVVAGITAIWKYNPDKKNESNDIEKFDNADKHQLDKTE